MRTLTVRFPDDALSTLDTFVKQTKEARVFRRAQAVRAPIAVFSLAHMGAVSLLEPDPQRRVAQRHRGCAIGHLARYL